MNRSLARHQLLRLRERLFVRLNPSNPAFGQSEGGFPILVRKDWNDGIEGQDISEHQ